MAVTQPTLDGNALPWPQQDGGYQVRYEYRGGASVMADGSMLYDLVASGAKRVITLTWVHLDEDDRNTVMTELAALGTASLPLANPEGDTVTVTLDENMTLPTWATVGVPDGSGGQNLRFSGSVTLREV